MLMCPNGHGSYNGNFCPECGCALRPPAAPPGDALRVRSPESHATASVNPTFVLPGAGAGSAPPVLTKCPKCGHRNPEAEVFDCQGPCGRVNLCRRHFDEEYDLCRDCSAPLHEVAERETAQQAQVLADARRAVADLQARLNEREKGQAAAQTELVAKAQALRQAEVRVAEQAKLLNSADAVLQGWRGRAERAEAELAELRRKLQATAEAAEAVAREPVWQRIGIELVKIPAGEFSYGPDKRRATLMEYWLAKTPVTNAQYKAFVEATGHEPPKHWEGGQIPRGKDNHPVVFVSWEDAQAFSAWAGLRLPGEREWEKGARGTDGRDYPWGRWAAGRCNSGAGYAGTPRLLFEDTSPVDRFPTGASPYRLLDMAGNVYEWCIDCHDARQNDHVVRGGCWVSKQAEVTTYYRWHATGSDAMTGFRCARSG